jgi:hypothetical protein
VTEDSNRRRAEIEAVLGTKDAQSELQSLLQLVIRDSSHYDNTKYSSMTKAGLGGSDDDEDGSEDGTNDDTEGAENDGDDGTDEGTGDIGTDDDGAAAATAK